MSELQITFLDIVVHSAYLLACMLGAATEVIVLLGNFYIIKLSNCTDS